jgi:zinc and cadmium transporter
VPFLAGAILAYAVAGSVDVTVLVPFAAGNFIYIALADLLPQMTAQERARDKAVHTISFAVGLAILWVLALTAG